MATIREVRVNQDITQEALAKSAGVCYHTVFRLEAGCPVRKTTALAICRVLGVSLDAVEGINFYSAVRAHSKPKKGR